jgi:Zn ribbon nucleic-acid-binding protein
MVDAEFRELRSCLWVSDSIGIEAVPELCGKCGHGYRSSDKELNDRRNERWNECFDD